MTIVGTNMAAQPQIGKELSAATLGEVEDVAGPRGEQGAGERLSKAGTEPVQLDAEIFLYLIDAIRRGVKT